MNFRPNLSYFTLILTFFRNVTKAMSLKKGFIRAKNPKFSLQIKKFKSDQSLIEIGISHNEYSHSTKLNKNTINSLSADFN